MAKMLTYFAIVVPIFCLGAKADDLAGGIDAYNRGDYTAAFRAWYPLAQGGNPKAEFLIGHMYLSAFGITGDYAEAMIWLRRAADQGNAPAEYEVGFMYEGGAGVKRDPQEAFRWFRKAAADGSVQAELSLGSLSADSGEQMSWLLKAAEHGNPQAAFNIGYKYHMGLGVEKDETRAIVWFQKALQMGVASSSAERTIMGRPQMSAITVSSAQLMLGMLYEAGTGVPQDYVQAVDYIQRAAEGGNAQAMFRLGLLFAYGRGVKQSYITAAHWFQLGALRGDAEAQAEMGAAYEFSRGVSMEYVEAYKWYTIALKAPPYKQLNRSQVTAFRNRVMQRMTPAQIADAEKRADQWRVVDWPG